MALSEIQIVRLGIWTRIACLLYLKQLLIRALPPPGSAAELGAWPISGFPVEVYAHFMTAGMTLVLVILYGAGLGLFSVGSIELRPGRRPEVRQIIRHSIPLMVYAIVLFRMSIQGVLGLLLFDFVFSLSPFPSRRHRLALLAISLPFIALTAWAIPREPSADQAILLLALSFFALAAGFGWGAYRKPEHVPA